MTIPKILHQTGPSQELTEPFRTYRQQWRERHPTWEYRFYDDKQCRSVVQQSFPALLPIYDAYPYPIQRADLFRFIVIFHFGGFYFDLDVAYIRRLDDLCGFNCVFGEENRLTAEAARALGHRHRIRVANYMFGAKAGHPFLLHVLLWMVNAAAREINTDKDILTSTGPGIVTRVFFENCDKFKDIVLLENKDRRCMSPYHNEIACHFGDYAHHQHVGSWRQLLRQQRKASTYQRLSQQRTRLISQITAKIEQGDIPEKILILKTYTEKERDGLATVYHRAKKVGSIRENTRMSGGKKVLICGVPFLYTDRISPLNTNVLFTTFESTKLPPLWVQAINRHYHQCIVPHAAIRSVFVHSGVKIPITLIPQGFTRYKRGKRSFRVHQRFRIGFLGAPVGRKNLVKLFQACANLIPKMPHLKLAVHVSAYYDWFDQRAMATIKAAPFVEWSEGDLPDDAMGEWYRRLSCYAFPSSGEGWSFTPRESLYMGVPTLITNIPVHDRLVQSGYCAVIRTTGWETAYFEGNASGQWQRVDVADIEETILDVYAHYGAYQIRALQGSQWIERQWSNYGMQQQLLNFLWQLPAPGERLH